VRYTKIVATAGPATEDDIALDALVRAGVDIFRLNFSHGDHQTHGLMTRRIRSAADRAGRIVAILQDLSGPKIRTGPLADGPLELREGEALRIVIGNLPSRAGQISTTFRGLAEAVTPGDRLLLDDGRIELKAVASTRDEIRTVVTDGGTLGAYKGINAPNVVLPSSAVTDKDVHDLRFGLEIGVDVVALSFVQTGEDLQRARAVVTAAGRPDVPLIAKLERPAAIAHLDEIFESSDGVMVARGDLGLEMPLERVPRVQKEITRRARAKGLPVILATQVFESMVREPRPTRAEVSDAANAVVDGVDAIMLAGETAIGAFPARAVEVLDSVIRDAEAFLPYEPSMGFRSATFDLALCEAAVTLARTSSAGAVVAVTRGGNTARVLAALRPRVPIYAATETTETARRMMLLHGVFPVVVPISDDVQQTAAMIEQQLVRRGVFVPGAVLVLVSINPDLSRHDANFLKLHRVGG